MPPQFLCTSYANGMLSSNTQNTCIVCTPWFALFNILLFTEQTFRKSLKLEGERARTSLKVLQTLTYACTSPQDLHDLTTTVERLITEFKEKLPKLEGIVLRPEARKSVRKRAQQIVKKYRPLPQAVKRGRKKRDWHYQNRVGQRASTLRKVYVHVNTHTIIKLVKQHSLNMYM